MEPKVFPTTITMPFNGEGSRGHSMAGQGEYMQLSEVQDNIWHTYVYRVSSIVCIGVTMYDG